MFMEDILYLFKFILVIVLISVPYCIVDWKSEGRKYMKSLKYCYILGVIFTFTIHKDGPNYLIILIASTLVFQTIYIVINTLSDNDIKADIEECIREKEEYKTLLEKEKLKYTKNDMRRYSYLSKKYGNLDIEK